MPRLSIQTLAPLGAMAIPAYAVFALGLSGCTTTAAPARSVTLTCRVPVITPQAETKESQEKGGVEISIAPASYAMAVKQHVTLRQIPPPMVSLTTQRGIYVERTTDSVAEVSPDTLRFVLKVNNKMPRVFHGAGTIVQFNVGGRLQAVDQSGYGNFLGAIIPPRQELQIEIVGPRLSTLPSDHGTIGVFLYDVVTDQNAAGVVTEKQNFEWYFDYTMRTEERAAESHTEEVWLSATEYSQEVVRESVERAQSGGR